MRPRHATARILTLGSLLLSSCRPDPGPCGDYARPGDKIQVVVLGPDTSVDLPVFGENNPPCPLDDIHAGDTFEIEIGKPVVLSNDCYNFSCPADFPAPSEPTGKLDMDTWLNFVCLNRERKVRIADDCEAGRLVALYSPWGARDIYAPAAADGTTAVNLVRALTLASRDPERPRCDSVPSWADGWMERRVLCADRWRVELKRIE